MRGMAGRQRAMDVALRHAESLPRMRSVAATRDGSSNAQQYGRTWSLRKTCGTRREEEADLAERDVRLGRQRRLG